MRIDGSRSDDLTPVGDVRRAADIVPAQDVADMWSATASTQLTISGEARLRAQEALASVPESQQDELMSLRAQIRAGAYAIDDQALAAAIVRRVDLRA